MSTASGSALGDARPLETKAGNPGRTADPVAVLAAEITRQGEQIAALETKRTVSVGDAKAALHERTMRTTEALRQTAEEKARAERRGRADPLLNVRAVKQVADINDSELARKHAKLEKEVSEMRAAMARPRGPAALGQKSGASGAGRSSRDATFALYRKATMHYLRTGSESFQGHSLRDLEQKTLSTDSDPAGGYLVAPEHDTGPIEALLRAITPMRQFATVRPISGSSLKKAFNVHGGTANWVGERAPRPETNTPQIKMLEYPAMELYAKPAATMSMLEDSAIDLEAWLAEESLQDFAEKESQAFIVGDGQNKPKGLIGGYDIISNATYDPVRDFGKFGYIATGVADGLAASTTAANAFDQLIKLPYALKPVHRQAGAFVMNKATIGSYMAVKDGQGHYIWQPMGKDGQPATLIGYPVMETEEMPDIAADAFPIGFGDLKRTYIIVDRVGMSTLRDPYTANPFVLFITRKRVGGGVQNFESFKFMKVATA